MHQKLHLAFWPFRSRSKQCGKAERKLRRLHRPRPCMKRNFLPPLEKVLCEASKAVELSSPFDVIICVLWKRHKCFYSRVLLVRQLLRQMIAYFLVISSLKSEILYLKRFVWGLQGCRAIESFWRVHLCIKLLFEMKMTKVYSKTLLMKVLRNNSILTCILPHYVFHESPKYFWKNNHFENMRAIFLRACQNSLWQTIHEMMHF